MGSPCILSDSMGTCWPFRSVNPMLGLTMQRPFALPLPRSTIRPGPQRLGRCNSGFISPASRSNTGSALGHGKCSTRNRQHLPSSVRVNAQESNSLCVCAGPHNCVRLAVSFALQRSPCAGLFSVCTSASVVGCVHPCSVNHTSPSYCPALAMRLSRIAVAAAGVIAITTVATNTKAPSDGRNHDALPRPACANAHAHAHANAHAHAHTNAHVHACANAHMHARMNAHMHARTNAHAHACANAHTNARTLRTAQPCHRNSQKVNHTCTQHRCCRWGPGASPGTCQRCPAQQQRKVWCSATD